MSLYKQISLSSMHRLVQVLCSVVLVLFMMSKWGAGEYGFYAYYISVATIILSLAEFGTPTVFRREFSGCSEVQKVKVFSNLCAVRVALIIPSAAVSLALAEHYKTWFFVFYAGIILLLIFRISEYQLETEFNNKLISKTKSIVYILGCSIKLLLVAKGFKLEAVAFVTLLEHCIFTIVFFRAVRFWISIASLSLAHCKSLLVISSIFAMSSLVVVLGGKLYTIIVFSLLGEERTGVFAFSARMIEILLVPTQVFSVVLLPLLMKTNDKRVFYQIYSSSVCVVFYAYVLAAALFWWLQGPLLGLVIDESKGISEFIGLYALVAPVMALYALSTAYYTAKHENQLILLRSVLFLGFSALSGVLFIKHWGLNGVVLSLLSTYVLLEFVSVLISRQARIELAMRTKFMLWPLRLKASLVNLYRVKAGG